MDSFHELATDRGRGPLPVLYGRFERPRVQF